MNTKNEMLNISRYEKYHETLITSGKSNIALSIYYSNKGDPCIVFLPGTMVHPLFYDDFLSKLAGYGFNIVAVHFISHGKSMRDHQMFTFDDMVQNVHDAVTYSIENLNENVIVLGSSQGGVLALASAINDQRVKAVFPHNVMLPELRDTLDITSFPKWLKMFYRFIPPILSGIAKMFPTFQVPLDWYLQPERVSENPEVWERFDGDPLILKSYPLSFIASLFSADLSGATNGAIHCPVIMIASTGDRLFEFQYILQVFAMIVAPHKEMLKFEEPYHLIFNEESVSRIIPRLAAKLKEYS